MPSNANVAKKTQSSLRQKFPQVIVTMRIMFVVFFRQKAYLQHPVPAITMFALRLNPKDNKLLRNEALKNYATLLFSSIPPRSFDRHDDAQRIVIVLDDNSESVDEHTRISGYGWEAKEAWKYHADAVLVPAQSKFENYYTIVSTIRTETYGSIPIWLSLTAKLATAEHLRILDTMHVRAVVLMNPDTVKYAVKTKRDYHLSLRILAHASEHTSAFEVHTLRQAGAEQVILTAMETDQSTLEACERARQSHVLTFGTGRTTLRKILVNAVNIVQHVPETQAPFVTKSGLETRTYLDARRLVSYPKYLTQVAKGLLGLVPHDTFDLIAGIPTGAVPLATVMSQLSGKPLIMLRDKPKTYGMRKQVEGVFQYNRRCLLVEDVTTTGMSILKMLHVVRRTGMEVPHAVVVVARDRQKPYALLEKANCTLHALFSLNDAMQLE
jgi:orotate phosphoribosyltransferase